MPIYEYQCSKCGEFEVMQRMSDKPLRTCPTCRRKVIKLMSNTSFQLKGSGWYVTDYARKGETDSKKGEGKSETAKSESSKGDSTSGDAAKGDSAKSADDSGSASSGKKKGKAKSTPKAAAA